MPINFIGREKELAKFKHLLKQPDGAVWAITGKGGQGKSSLLKQCADMCEQQRTPFLWLAVDRFELGLESWEFAADFLLGLDSGQCAEFKTAQDKAAGVHQSIVAQIRQELSKYKEEAGEAVALWREQHVDEEHEQTFAAVTDKYVSTFLKVLSEFYNSKQAAAQKAIAENVELFLVSELAKLCQQKRLVIFVDTFEYLSTRDNLRGRCLKTQLDLDRFAPLAKQQTVLDEVSLSVWLNAFLSFLRSQGALIVVAGRTVKPWDQYAEADLADFQRAELLEFVKACDYPAVQAVWRECSGLFGVWKRWRGQKCRLDALLQALARLSFGGKPLWVRVGLNCLAELLKQGEDIAQLMADDRSLQACFEQDFAAIDVADTEHARCKLAVFTHVMRQTDPALVESVWKLALPRRLDRNVLQVLFGEQAQTLLQVYGNMGILAVKRGQSEFVLHEEIRDLLQFYAREKGFLQSVEADKLHEQLAALFEQRSWRTLPEFDDFKWQDWDWLVEVFYHREKGQGTEFEHLAKNFEIEISEACQEVLSNPKSRWGWFAIGYYLSKLDNPKEAAQAYQKQIVIVPEDDGAWNNMGNALYNQGKLEEAIQAYQKQIDIVPDDDSAWNNIGNALSAQGKLEEAIQAYQKQIDIMPDDNSVWVRLGIAFWHQGNLTQAAEAFAQSLKIKPDDLSALANDIELALVQQDCTRMQQRFATLQPLLQPNEDYYAILPFLNWLSQPETSLQPILTAIQQLNPDVKFTWDFNDTQPAIDRLSPTQQQLAQHCIDYFEGKIDFNTLQTQLTTYNPETSQPS